MQKASIGKILLALVISCVYIYLFGIVQVLHVSADNEREIEVSIPEVTTSAETEKTPETTTIKLQDDKKPTLADVKAQVVSDYQDFKEKEWMKKLRSEAKVEVRDDIVTTVSNH